MRKYNRTQHSLNFFKSLKFVLVLITTGIIVSLNLSFDDSYGQNNHEKPSVYFVSIPDIQCPENITEGLTYTDENGCVQPCPVDPEVILPEECVQPEPPNTNVQLTPEELSAGDEESADEQQEQPTSNEQLTPEELSAGDEESPEEQESLPLQENNPTLFEGADQLNQPDVFTDTADNFVNNTTIDTPRDLIPKNKPPIDILAPSKCSEDITGKWTGNDGATYFIRQIGLPASAKIWWFGSNSLREGEGFSNVFSGDRTGLRITGQWQDIPMGISKNSGTMTLLIDPAGNKITKSSAGGDGFSGTEWTKKCIKQIGKAKTFSQASINSTIEGDDTVDFGGMTGAPSSNDVVVR